MEPAGLKFLIIILIYGSSFIALLFAGRRKGQINSRTEIYVCILLAYLITSVVASIIFPHRHPLRPLPIQDNPTRNRLVAPVAK